MVDKADEAVGAAARVEAVRAVVRLARLLERASPDLSLAQYRVLAAVSDGHARASRVAARLALGKPAVSSAVEALCRRGLLERESVAADQRAVALRITPAGAALLTTAEHAMLARFDGVLRRTADPDATVRQLAALGATLDQVAEDRLAGRA